MTRTPEDALRDARTHFALMPQHAQGDLADQLVIDAICMRLSAGVEALARPGHPDPGSGVGRRMAAHVGDAQPHRRRLHARRHSHRAPDPEHDIPPILASIEAELADAN